MNFPEFFEKPIYRGPILGFQRTIYVLRKNTTFVQLDCIQFNNC